MNRKYIIGVMGPGDSATQEDLSAAETVGRIVAEQGHILLTGGRSAGVMEAAMKGAKSAGGTTLGILPGSEDQDLSAYVDIAIKTGMGQARNNINVLTADLIIAIGQGPGTVSEISLSIKAGKTVILLSPSSKASELFGSFNYPKLLICNELSKLKELISANL